MTWVAVWLGMAFVMSLFEGLNASGWWGVWPVRFVYCLGWPFYGAVGLYNGISDLVRSVKERGIRQ